MSSRTSHETVSIARDAIQLIAEARKDLDDPRFSEHIDRHELDVQSANAEKLKSGSAARTVHLDNQVAAGVHLLQVCAKLGSVCQHVRDEAELKFYADAKTRDEDMAHAFGRGWVLDLTSVSSVEAFAHGLLEAAKNNPKQATKVHLDARGIHHVHDLLTALEGADIAHVQRRAQRHDATTALNSLAHLVSAESAHIRFVAKRVFRDDETRLAHYDSTLPRHPVKHRSRHAPADPAPKN